MGRVASWEETCEEGGGGGVGGDREDVTGTGAGRAEGGLEGGGSLPALLDRGEGEERWGAKVLR